MGAEPWHYFVAYEQDVNFTLQKLREREFKAARYYGSEHQPENIEEALSNQSDNGSTAVEVALKMAYQSAGKSKSTASEIYCF